MKISSSFDNNYSGTNRRSFKGIPIKTKYMPEWVGSAGKWAGEYISMPEQKLFLAATAFLFQPAIDMKYAEEDKKSDVAIKSASKAIAGGITGVSIRVLFEKYFNNKIGYTEDGIRKQNIINDYLFPTKVSKIRGRSISEADILLRKYCATLSIMISLLVMSFYTNEKIDAPLTSDFQDLFTGVARDNKTWSESFDMAWSNRKNKIKGWFKNKKESIKTARKKFQEIINIIQNNNTANTQKNNKGKEG